MKNRRIRQVFICIRSVLGVVYCLLMAQFVLNDRAWGAHLGSAALTCLGLSLVAVLLAIYYLRDSRTYPRIDRGVGGRGWGFRRKN